MLTMAFIILFSTLSSQTYNYGECKADNFKDSVCDTAKNLSNYDKSIKK